MRLKYQKLISNLRATLWEVTSLLSPLCSAAQAVLPAMLQNRFLQQQQMVAIRNNPFYRSTVYLNEDSIQELQWWFNNLDICNGKLIVFNLQNSNTIRCLQKGLGGVFLESFSRGSVISPGVKPPYQCSRNVSHQTSPFNIFKNVQSQISPFPSRQYERPFIPDETGGYTKQGDDSHFQRDLGICIAQRDHAYCRVPAGQIQRQGRLDFQKFPRPKRMATTSKCILRNMCKVEIPRVRSFCINSMPSNTILPVVENRSTRPSNRCIPTELETSGATVCFSPFFNDRESSIKGQNRGGGCNFNNTKLASTTLVQSDSVSICNRTSASTSVKQHLSKSLGPSKPFSREQNHKTGGLERFRQSLASEGISARAAELITSARRPGTSLLRIDLA